MNKFHKRCGDRVTLLNYNLTAIRNFVEFNHGLILSAEPLVDDVMFEVRIDRKVNVWNGSLEIGVTTLDPEFIELPATATKLRDTAWILSGNSIVKDCVTLLDDYGPELDSLREGDCVGVSRSNKGELMFFINGRCLGVAAKDIPPRVFAVIDLYGQCVQVSIIHNNYSSESRIGMDSMNEISEYADPEDEQQETDPLGWFGPPIYTRDTHIQMPIVCPLVSQDHLRFHPRCGILVKLSSNNKTAERARPLDDYNNGVVMTHRPLCDNELFEIRIDRLVDKWSGSIEVGVTTHNPATIRFPSTMTNMDSGTIMMSGCKVLLNGHGTCMEYGNFNLDELKEGDTVGMMRKSNGKLHYYINGIDQGVATDKVASQVWGVIDLYGMTVKVTIKDPCDCVDNNIDHMPIRVEDLPKSEYGPANGDTLLFHTLRDSDVIVINDGKTAHRPNAFEHFNNGIVVTNRTLKTNELFLVRLDLVIPKWAGSIEIGVTQHSSKDIKLPFKMSDAKSGTWAITGEDVIRDGTVIIPQYVRNLNKLVEGDMIGVMRQDFGTLHFFLNGVDLGPAAENVPNDVYGIIDLYGRVAQASIVDMFLPPTSPVSLFSSGSNATVFPEMCFHRVHGRNARLSRNRLTASRAAVYSEFNDAVLFSSRPLRECDMFEIRIEKMVDCWIGSLEIGVTAIRPDDLEASGGVGAIAGTATDLSWDTYILSGAAMMKDGECVRSGYPLDLDTLTEGSRVGIMWHADRSIHYYLDGMDMGQAWYVPHLNIYAVVDLYGQCSQVSIVQNGDRNYNYNGCSGDQYYIRRGYDTPPPPYWTFSEYCGDNIILRTEYNFAERMNTDPMGAFVFSSHHLLIDEIYEIQIHKCTKSFYAGSFRMGVTDVNILNANVNRHFPLTISWLPHFTAYIDGRYLKYSKPGTREQKVKSFVPSLEWLRLGDRVGFKKTADSRVLVYYNSELLDTAIENVPDKVYVVCELGGNVTMIKSVPRGTPVVQPNQITLQNDGGIMSDTKDSNTSDANATDNATGEIIVLSTNTVVASAPPLSSENETCSDTNEASGDQAEGSDAAVPGPSNASPAIDERAPDEEAYLASAPSDSSESDIDEAVEVDGELIGINEAEMAAEASAYTRPQHRALPYTFHNMHGRNVRLCSSDTVAMRYRGYSEGIAVASQPMRRGNHFRFRVDRISQEWQGTMCIGAVSSLPSDALPRSALNINTPAWLLTHDALINRGRYIMTDRGRSLSDVSENSVLSLHFRFNSDLALEVDGVNRGIIANVPRLYTNIYPAIDLYGRVVQVSILLHPRIITGGNSLDLPVIEEDPPDVADDDGYGGDDDDDDSPGNEQRDDNFFHRRLDEDRYHNWRTQVRNDRRNMRLPDSFEDHGRGSGTGPSSGPGSSRGPGPSRGAGPSSGHGLNNRPDYLPGLPNTNDERNNQIKTKQIDYKKALHQSLILPLSFGSYVTGNDEGASYRDSIVHSISPDRFIRPPPDGESDEEDEDSQNSLINALSLGSRMGEDDDSLDILDVCDTNIRHNDRYPEASDVDLLDNEIIDALTLDAGNLPDLTEEQSPSVDESTRRDDLWSDGIMNVETLRYLNNITRHIPEAGSVRFADRDWVFYSQTNGNCEHMHLSLKFWNYLVQPYPDMREIVASGQVRCFCINCRPDAGPPFAGWVRIERGASSKVITRAAVSAGAGAAFGAGFGTAFGAGAVAASNADAGDASDAGAGAASGACTASGANADDASDAGVGATSGAGGGAASDGGVGAGAAFGADGGDAPGAGAGVAGSGSPGTVFWHVLRSTLVSAGALSGEDGAVRRPALLAPAPAIHHSASDIWFDEEGKPHHAVLALDIEVAPESEPTNDRLIAYMIYLKSRFTFNEENAEHESSDEE